MQVGASANFCTIHTAKRDTMITIVNRIFEHLSSSQCEGARAATEMDVMFFLALCIVNGTYTWRIVFVQYYDTFIGLSKKYVAVSCAAASMP